MKEIQATDRFLRGLKISRKRGKDLRKIEGVIDVLAKGRQLAARHRPHRLQGDMKGLWECHVEPDWLLIWDETEEAVQFVRTGTHADLFD